MRRFNKVLTLAFLGITALGVTAMPFSVNAENIDAGVYDENHENEDSVNNETYLAGEVIYDASEFDTYKNRTMKEVANKYVEAFYNTGSYNDKDEMSYYNSRYSLDAPLRAGALTSDTHNTVSNVIDYYRWLAGSNPLQNKSTVSHSYATKLQKQALARNFDYSDTIDDSKVPYDGSAIMPDGRGMDYNLKNMGKTPVDTVMTWINGKREESVATAATRSVILNPNNIGMEFAYSGEVALLQATDSKTPVQLNEAFMAFPAPGYNPTQIMDATNAGWSVYINNSIFKKTTLANIEVSIKNLRTNKVYTTSSKYNGFIYETDSTFSYIYVSGPHDNGYGSGFKDSYAVEVKGFEEISTGKPVILKYQVDFFDAFAESDKKVVVSATSSLITSVSIDGDTTEANLIAAANVIPREIKATDINGDVTTFSVASRWNYVEKDSAFEVSADEDEIPSNLLDPYKILTKASIKVGISQKNSYTASVYPKAIKEGGSVKFTTMHYPSTDRTKFIANIYKYDPEEIECNLAYSDASPEFYQTDVSRNYDYYEIKNAPKSVTGLYIYLTKTTDSSYADMSIMDLQVRDTGYVTAQYPPVHQFSYRLADGETVDMYAKLIPHEAFVVTDLGEIHSVKTVGAWTYDSEKEGFVNKIDKSSFPKNVIDVNNITDDEIIIYGYDEHYILSNPEIRANSLTPRRGGTLELCHFAYTSIAYRTLYDKYYVVKCDDKNDEVTFYTTDSPEYDKAISTDDEPHYVFNNVDESVNGKYYLIRNSLHLTDAGITDSNYYERQINQSYAEVVSVPITVEVKDIANLTYADYHRVYTKRYTEYKYDAKLQVILPRYAFLKTDTGEEIKHEISEWERKLGRNGWKAKVELDDLPEWVNSPFASLECSVSPYNSNETVGDYTLAINNNGTVCEPGSKVVFTMSNLTEDKKYSDVKLFKLVETSENSGKYESTVVFDSTIDGNKGAFEKTGTYTYIIPSMSVDDEGEYMAMWYQKDGSCDTNIYISADSYDITADHADIGIKEGKAPTCTEAGLSDGKYCKICNEVIEEQKTIPAKGHTSKVLNRVEPTCVAVGKTEGKICSECNTILEAQKDIPKTAHKYTAEVANSNTLKSKATIDSPAVYYYSCEVCGNVDKSANAKTFTSGEKEIAPVDVYYTTHVQSFGWQGDPDVSQFKTWKKNGEMSGTSGLAKRLEGIEIKLDTKANLGIEYRTHIQTYGWEKQYKANGVMSGTKGEAKRLEAISIRLTGADKDKYDVFYRVHAQSYGWLGWAKNGENAGTAAQAKRLEGIEIVVLPKGQTPKEGTVGYSYIELGKAADNGELDGMVNYMTHVQSYGDQSYVYDGSVSGTFGEAKRLEGIRIKLNNEKIGYAGGIEYCTQVQTYGWLDPTSNGAFNGTHGEAKRLEAIKIKLTGEVANHYDVYYRVHSQTYGWLGWAKNGEAAGTVGLAKRLEGIQIVLVPKGQGAPNYLPGKADVKPCIEK